MSRVIFPILLGVVGVAVLLSLGFWQVRRLEWKTEMLDRIESHIGADPIEIPVNPDPVADEYTPVGLEGQILPGAAYVLIGVTGGSPEFRLIVPVSHPDGPVLADLGAVADALPPQMLTGPVTVTGNLHWPDEVSSWTPPPELDAQEWFARDVTAMADHLGTRPIMVVARQHSRSDLPTRLIPVSTRAIPNDHLGYAITWFGLALVWAVMSFYLIRRSLNADRSSL